MAHPSAVSFPSVPWLHLLTLSDGEFPTRGGGGGRGGSRYGDRYSDDRRGGYGRRDDYGSRSNRYDDRGYGGGGGGGSGGGGGGYGGSRRDDYGPRGVDRYASDRGYSGRDSGRDDRRGGGGGYERPPPPAAGGYDSAPPPRGGDAYSGSRSYEGDYNRSYR